MKATFAINATHINDLLANLASEMENWIGGVALVGNHLVVGGPGRPVMEFWPITCPTKARAAMAEEAARPRDVQSGEAYAALTEGGPADPGWTGFVTIEIIAEKAGVLLDTYRLVGKTVGPVTEDGRAVNIVVNDGGDPIGVTELPIGELVPVRGDDGKLLGYKEPEAEPATA